MDRLILTFGSKDFFLDDVHFLAKKWTETPRIVTATSATAKETVIEKASALFLETDLVVVLLDPTQELLERIVGPLSVLKERAYVIIYSTVAGLDVPRELGAVKVAVEQEKEKRFKEKVLSAVKADGKKMTDKAYSLLKERILDESLLDAELAKLIGYVGDKTLIETKDVAAVVTEMHEEDFITLSEAMARKDKKQIMLILETLLSHGMNVLAIHGFMARHIRLLLQARDAEEFFAGASDFRSFSKNFGGLKGTLDPVPLDKRQYLAYQKPYYAYNLSKTSRKFREETLVSFLGMLADLDYKVKKGTRYDRTNFEEGLLGV
jgi:hypothetical protein